MTLIPVAFAWTVVVLEPASPGGRVMRKILNLSKGAVHVRETGKEIE